MLVPVAYASARVAASPALRVCGVGRARASGVVALALTYSRAGWMGFAAAFAFSGRGAHALRRAARPPPSWLAGSSRVLLLFNAHHNPSEDYTRLSIWQAAMQIIDRFPLTGVGPFNFSRLYAVVRGARRRSDRRFTRTAST